jgi:hypothetical protein
MAGIDQSVSEVDELAIKLALTERALEMVNEERLALGAAIEQKDAALRYYTNSKAERTNCIPPHRSWHEDDGEIARSALAIRVASVVLKSGDAP